jgi:uncharacterized damage-inducible protein DinB
MSDPRFPIGKFSFEGTINEQQRAQCLNDIAEAPALLRAAVKGLSDKQLDTPYRDGGWTVRQLVHHVPDSHMNAYVRFKLAMTENEPTIRPYMEDRWAELSEAKTGPIEMSLQLLENLHERWVVFLRTLKAEDWKRTFRHPDLGVLPLEKVLALYAWHGKHHVAHVTVLKERMGW